MNEKTTILNVRFELLKEVGDDISSYLSEIAQVNKAVLNLYSNFSNICTEAKMWRQIPSSYYAETLMQYDINLTPCGHLLELVEAFAKDVYAGIIDGKGNFIKRFNVRSSAFLKVNYYDWSANIISQRVKEIEDFDLWPACKKSFNREYPEGTLSFSSRSIMRRSYLIAQEIVLQLNLHNRIEEISQGNFEIDKKITDALEEKFFGTPPSIPFAHEGLYFEILNDILSDLQSGVLNSSTWDFFLCKEKLASL